jgi:MFS family permease
LTPRAWADYTGGMASRTTAADTALPRLAWVLGLVSLFTDVGTEMVFAVLPLFLVGELGVSVAAVGLLEGVAEATAALLKLVSGVLADRTGRPKALALSGYGLSALTKPLFALAPGLGWVAAARWLDRVGKGLRATPRDVLLAAATLEGRRGRAFGLRQTFDKLGESLGPLLATGLLILAPGRYRLVLGVACFPGLLAVALLALGVREAEAVPRRAGRPLPRVADLRRLGPQFSVPLAVAALLGLATFSDAFLLLRAQNLGVATRWVPLVLLAMNLTASAGAYTAGVFADTRGHRRALTAGVYVYALGCGLLAAARGPIGAWVGVVLLGLHLALVRGNLLAWVSDTVPQEDRGAALGWVYLTQGAALLPASFIAGWLWQQFGPPLAFALAALLAAGTLPLLTRREPRGS